MLSTTADEMSPATRRLLQAVGGSVAERGDYSFTRRELRYATGLGDSQLKVHLARLVDLEYLTTNRCGPATTYELVGAESCLRPDRPVGRSTSAGPLRRTKKPLPTGGDGPSPVDRPVLRALRGTGAGHGGDLEPLAQEALLRATRSFCGRRASKGRAY